MGGQPEAVGSQSGAAQPAGRDFRANVTAIDNVLSTLNKAEQTPDLLEQDAAEMEGVTLAEYLYTIARWCRDAVEATTDSLRTAGWAGGNEAQFMRSFWNLVDAWTTYHGVLRYRQDADYTGAGPTPGQVLADLQTPRRGFITALDAYRVQLLIVQRCLPDTGVTAAS